MAIPFRDRVHYDDDDPEPEYYDEDEFESLKTHAGRGVMGFTSIIEIVGLVALLVLDVVIGGAFLALVLKDLGNSWFDYGIPFGLETASSSIQLVLWRKLRHLPLRELVGDWRFWMATVITLIDTRMDTDLITYIMYGYDVALKHFISVPSMASEAWWLISIFVGLLMLGNEPILMWMIKNRLRKRKG